MKYNILYGIVNEKYPSKSVKAVPYIIALALTVSGILTIEVYDLNKLGHGY